MNQTQLIFGCAVTNAVGEAQACLLAESVRKNGGRYADEVIRVYVLPGAHQLSERAMETFERLSVETIDFQIDPACQGVPFASKVAASAMAEEMATGRCQLLVWLDPDTIFFQEPAAMVLDAGKELGCRPVDHKLIGSPIDQPADAFWQDVYQLCNVPQDRLFVMTTSADEISIRPYINAGCLVVRPQMGLLQRWQVFFRQALVSTVFEPYFEHHVLCRIFLHQAILAGTALSTLQEDQIQILPHLVNYPMHMHGQYPPALRPAQMNDLISGRHDTFFDDPDWLDSFSIEEPLRSWLSQQVVAYGLAQDSGC